MKKKKLTTYEKERHIIFIFLGILGYLTMFLLPAPWDVYEKEELEEICLQWEEYNIDTIAEYNNNKTFRESIGKNTLLMNISYSECKNDKKVLAVKQ